MLYLDEPIQIGRLSLFRDYNEPSLFYFLPNSPRVATEGGDPLFHLLIWRDEDEEGNEEGGGFLTMTADLHVSQGTLEEARREVSRRFGVSARLAPVPVESGAVKVSMLDASSDQEQAGSFVEDILAHGTSSLYGDNRAVFKAELSQRGAVAMRESLLNEGASPVMLVYELTYRGLLPAYQCKIVIEFEQSYQYLRNRTTFASLWLKADVDREVEELEKQGAIKIEEVVFDTDDPEARQQRQQQLQELARELAQWTFFKPGINPGEVLAKNVRDLHAVGGVEAGATVGVGRGTPLHRAMTGTGSPPGTPPERPASAGTSSSGTRLSGNPAPASDAAATEETSETTDEDTAAAPTPEQPAASSAVEAWDRAGRPQATYQLKDLRQEERQRITFDLKQVSATTRTIAPQGQLRLLNGMADGGDHIQEISLDDQFFKRIEGTISNQADLEALGVHSMNVELRYGADEDGSNPVHDESFLLDGAETHEFGFFRDQDNTLEVQYKVTVNYEADRAIGDDASKADTDWVTTTERHIEIDPRVAGGITVLELQAASVDWELVDQIQAKVIYQDPDGELDDETTVILEQDHQSDTLLVRPRSPEDPIAVAAAFHYKDGEVETVELSRVGTGPVIVNQPADSTHTVDVTLLDPLGRYEKVTVQFAKGGDAEPVTDRTIELVGNAARGSWSFRPEDGSREYRYRPTYFLSGPVREEPWTETAASQLLVGDRIAGVLRVEVVVLGAIETGGFRALRLRLRYPDAPDWADEDFEKTIVSGGPVDPILWEVPMADLDAKSYEVELQWFRQDGERLDIGPVTTSAETLLIDPNTGEVL